MTVDPDDEIMKEFLVESHENLDRLDVELVELERNPQATDTISSIFRTIHTIKGTSGFLGLVKLESITHVGENLLSKLRDGKLVLNSARISGLLAMGDAVREILTSLAEEGEEGERDSAALVERLTQLCNEDSNTEEAPSSVHSSDSTNSSDTREDVSSHDESLDEASDEDTESHDEDSDSDSVDETTESETPKAAAETPKAAAETPKAATPPPTVGKAPGEVKKPEAKAGSKSEGKSSNKAVGDSSIRVDVNLLDQLMNLVGELVLARNQILQHSTASADTGFLSTSQRLNILTTELQEGIMKTRMQPIDHIWAKFPRVVRDLSLACGKQVALEMEGKSTELDRSILEAIKDPLTHIIRNSVDHGIEDPSVRASRGKPECGTLRLRAFHEGGKVNIEIADDGGGIDSERVRSKAVQRGIITPERAERMTDNELINLIFLPGFSTAAKVTNVSGRGVGMDVVKSNIERSGGSVDIQSKLGEGTTLRIKIPLTLAIIPALIIASDDEKFAIPQVNLLELLHLEPNESGVDGAIEVVAGCPLYRLRGRLLPLVDLRAVLKLPPRDQKYYAEHGVNIVVLQADELQFGLVVDQVCDTEEIVVKPLGKLLKSIPSFAGATIRGDGRIALILDVSGVASSARITLESTEDHLRNRNNKGDSELKKLQRLLLVRSHNTTIAVPLSDVARLEEFKRDSLENAGRSLVVQYRGTILPIVSLAHTLGADPAPNDSDTIQAIVFSNSNDGSDSIGILVDAITDIVEESLEGMRGTNAPEFLGSIVTQGKVTDVLDVENMLRHHHSELLNDLPLSA